MKWLADILGPIVAAIAQVVIDAIFTKTRHVTQVEDATHDAPIDTPVTSLDDLLDVYGGVRPNN